MTRLFCMLVALVLIEGCWAQSDVKTGNLPVAASLFVELSTNHYIDKPWRKANINSIFHPNADYLGVMPKYESIQEIRPIVHGQALFLAAKVGKVQKGKAWVDYTKPNKEPEDALFIRIDYSVVATMEDARMRVLEKPVIASEYIVLAVDAEDGKYKVIGVYPSLKDELFIGGRYFLSNFEALSGDKNMKGQLENKIAGR